MDAFIGTVLAVGFNYPPRGWLFCNGQTVPVQQNAAMFALLGTMYGGDGQNTFGIPDLRGRVPVGSQAQGPGLANIPQGSKGGNNTTTAVGSGTVSFTLGIANLPTHTHAATFIPSALAVDTSNLKVSTAVTVGTGTNGVQGVVNNNGGLTSTSTSGASSASIYLPANTAPTSPFNLGGVTSTVSGSATISGTAAVTNATTGQGTAVVAPVATTANISTMPPYLGLNYIICQEGIFPSRN